MPFQKSSGDNEIPLESDVWNEGRNYTILKIVKLLCDLDRFQRMALYGKTDITEMVISEQVRLQNRTDGLVWFRDCLMMLIENGAFVIKKADIDDVESYDKILTNINFSKVFKREKIRINAPETIIINELEFIKIYNILRDIKIKLNFPLNHANLIFRSSEGIDIETIQKQFAEGG